MSEKQSSYRQVMKATSVFGGVQVINIVIQVLKSKAVAILLGPTGMGIHGLLIGTQTLMTSLTNFGLGTSGVKDVAAANGTGNTQRIAIIATVLNRWMWITGLFGTLLTLILSSYLSEWTFGNNDYTLAFIWISITMIFNQLSAGQMVVLQGLRKIKYLANAGITGSLLGLIIAIPLYYLLGIDGIVPAIIATSLANMIRSWYFARKVKLEAVVVDKVTTFREGKEMLRMGFMLSLSGLITTATSYLVRIYISNTGGIDDVGLYTAGFAIIVNYVGLVFTAMSTDYYPRLSGVAKDNKLACELINQQAEIAILILAPILCVFMVFINWVIVLLYSNQFIAINGMVQWAALGMFFKAASWSIAFIFLAKGVAKLFFWNELITNIYLLIFNVTGYKLAGLNGLGIAFLATYAVYFIQVFLIAKSKYSFNLNRDLIKNLGIQLILGIGCFLAVKLAPSKIISYGIGSILIIASGLYSLKELDKKMNLKDILKKVIKK
ncbi:MAG: O-antigen translocase [Carboxylicivirga sp.]|jgi:O-antigen/teichoic acid export membrane protein|nr:O-antigen translocase [Carboxylicivirga sp.]